jgi:alpha-tubulin suppressor-like RCC1 family protein
MLLLTVRVAAEGPPDLVITSISASPQIIAPGDSLTIKSSVKNQGNGDAGYFRTGMYLSTDPVITTGDVRIGSPKGNETVIKGRETNLSTDKPDSARGVYYIAPSRTIEIKSLNQTRRTTPVRETGYSSCGVTVASGAGHSLALKPDGGLWAWGSNSQGQLGDNLTTDKAAPVRIGKDTKWVAISAGLNHSLALKSDGTLWAWGNNSDGQLGDGTKVNKTAPVRIGKDAKWIAIEAGNHHSVGLKSDGTLWAWGQNTHGQLGDGTTAGRTAPVRAGKDSDWARVSAGAFHTVALKKDMTLWAWGNNSHGQLGDGTTENKTAPVRIGTDSRWAVSAGDHHTVALYWCADCWTTFSLWAWGTMSMRSERHDSGQIARSGSVRILRGPRLRREVIMP